MSYWCCGTRSHQLFRSINLKGIFMCHTLHITSFNIRKSVQNDCCSRAQTINSVLSKWHINQMTNATQFFLCIFSAFYPEWISARTLVMITVVLSKTDNKRYTKIEKKRKKKKYHDKPWKFQWKITEFEQTQWELNKTTTTINYLSSSGIKLSKNV